MIDRLTLVSQTSVDGLRAVNGLHCSLQCSRLLPTRQMTGSGPSTDSTALCSDPTLVSPFQPDHPANSHPSPDAVQEQTAGNSSVSSNRVRQKRATCFPCGYVPFAELLSSPFLLFLFVAFPIPPTSHGEPLSDTSLAIPYQISKLRFPSLLEPFQVWAIVVHISWWVIAFFGMVELAILAMCPPSLCNCHQCSRTGSASNFSNSLCPSR